MTTPDPRTVAALARRRSGAAGPHEDRRTRRSRTRTDRDRKAVAEQKAIDNG